MVVRPLRGAGRGPSRRGEQAVISLRRMTLGSGYRYLMESVAVGDGAPGHTSNLTRYYADVGDPARRVPGRRPGRPRRRPRGRAGFAGDRAAPVQPARDVRRPGHRQAARPPAQPLAPLPGQAGGPAGRRHPGDRTPAPNGPRRRPASRPRNGPREARFRTPVAGFDLTFSPSKSVSVAWALADRETKAQIYACHRRAIEVVLTYAEREVFHSRSGTNGVVQEDIEGVVAAAFTHWDSRAGDPQLHDHVVVANRARSVSDGTWRTLDSRGLFKSVVALSELHQGVLSDLLTKELGWGWDGRARRHSEQLRFEVTGVPEALMAEFSQRSAAIEERKTVSDWSSSSPLMAANRPASRCSTCGAGPRSRPGRPRSTTAWPR